MMALMKVTKRASDKMTVFTVVFSQLQNAGGGGGGGGGLFFNSLDHKSSEDCCDTFSSTLLHST